MKNLSGMCYRHCMLLFIALIALLCDMPAVAILCVFFYFLTRD